MHKKILSMILALVMVLGLLPATFATPVSATEAEYVYISVSFDGKYIQDKNNAYMAYIPVSFDALKAIDLNTYGLSDYLYDEDGDGNHEITALQLVIYAHEKLYGGSWSDVTFTGAPGSSYFQGGIFGFDENLNYYLNGQYPLAGSGWGATSDQIVLKPGDFIDLASFSSWDFYQDSAYGFHFFADGNGEITHAYTAEAGVSCDVKLIKGTKDYEYNSVFYDVPDYEVFYGTAYGDVAGSVTTDGNGCASITFPTTGTYYLWVDGGYGNEYSEAIVSAPGYAKVTVNAAEEPTPEEPENPREPQSVSSVLNATMAQLAATVTEPVFGTTAGEWTVLSLARGNYYAKDNAYFTGYYDRIVETVNTTAASVNMSGALHKNKSTENSRLIVALSALGKDATSVGDWDLVEAYSANGFSWIKKQGLNGTIWALIALDSNNYETSDPTIRQQCIDSILSLQHDDGGWALQANLTYASDPDVTGMALLALYPYRNDPTVAAACQEAFACLGAMQHENGTFASGGSECAESCAWVIVATTTWGINPDTDSRFIKNGKSVVDALLTHYLPENATFQHIVGAGSNAMATDQSCYALVAYDRFVNGKVGLFEYSDVTFEKVEKPETDELKVSLTVPEKVNAGSSFNGIVSITGWKNENGYKLIDFIVTVPAGVTVNSISVGDALSGGQLRWHLEEATGKLRVVYFDANNHSDLIVTNSEEIAALFTISFTAGNLEAGTVLDFDIYEMSLKKTSDASDTAAADVLDTEGVEDQAEIVAGLSFSAGVLYQGDGLDLIPADKKAIAVAVTGITAGTKLTYNDGTNTIEFIYSAEITAKTGIATYVALVDASIATENFANQDYFALPGGDATQLSFGDTNGDGVLNAQDALAVVDAWLRKNDAPTDDQILVLNVNGDGRINTFDALGIVEKFVSGSELWVVTKAATLTGNR